MKFTHGSWNLFIFICFQTFFRANLSNEFCQYTDLSTGKLECRNFSSFDQLNFTQLSDVASIRWLELTPINRIKLVNLSTEGLENCSIVNLVLRNVSGFEFYLPTDFHVFKNMSLDLDDSHLVFDEINEKITEK